MKLFSISILLVFIFLLTQLKGISQNHKVDSLITVLKTENEDSTKVKTLNAIAACYQDIHNYAKTMEYGQQAEELAEKLQFYTGMVDANLSMESTMSAESKWEEDLKFAIKLTDVREKMHEPDSHLVEHYITPLNACFNLNNFPLAMEYVLRGKKLAEKISYKSYILQYTYLLGVIYSRMNNLPKAKECFMQWVDLLKASGNQKMLGPAYEKMADIAAQENNNKVALDYYFKALHLYQYYDSIAVLGQDADKNYHKYKPRLATVFSSISEIYRETGDYKNALEYSIKCLEDGDTTKGTDVFTYPLYLCSNGESYMKLNDYDKAQSMFNKAFLIAKRIANSPDLENAYVDLSQLYYKKGDYKKAYDYFQLYTGLKDSVTNVETSKQVAELNTKYDAEKKDNQISLLNKEKEKQEAVTAADNKRQNAIIASVSFGLFVVMVFAFFIFRSNRQKHKANRELAEKNEVIEKQKATVEQQKALVEEKNKDIVDSITYAKRLQDAILPPLNIIKKALPESFVLYKPKDIIAGDFYWMEFIPSRGEGSSSGTFSPHVGKIQEGMVLIAACDCTGHGVPGAMVSVVCSNALNRTVKEFKITEPGKILDKVRELVLETFEKSESEVQDGMDISLCSLNTVTKEIKWSGANNPLWIVKAPSRPSPLGKEKGSPNGGDKEGASILEIAPDKQPIGKFDKQQPFTTITLNLQKGDTLYLFTDGYADQFGGPKGKKFKDKQLEEKLLAINSLGMDNQKEALDETIKNWKGTLDQVDDILIIGIRV